MTNIWYTSIEPIINYVIIIFGKKQNNKLQAGTDLGHSKQRDHLFFFNPFRYGLSDQRLGMVGSKRPPKIYAIIRPNKAYLCYF